MPWWNPKTWKRPKAGEQTGKQTATDVLALLRDLDDLKPTPGGTINTYRKMRGNPTIAMARAAATAPIQIAEHSYETDDGVPDDRRDFVESQIDRLWPDLVHNMLFALDYGYSPFEKVWEVDGGRMGLRKLKPLRAERTTVMVNKDDGGFAGLKQGGVELPPEKAFLYTYDMEAGNFYGRARMENVRKTWWRWMGLANRLEKYTTKISGVTPMVQYPEGTSRDKDGSEKDNYDLAVAILQSLGKAAGVAMPNTLAKYAEDLARSGLDIGQLRAWSIEFLETKAGHGTEMVEVMKHRESLMARGWLVPERSIQEGQHGTLAEAEAHTQLALVVAELTLRGMVRYINAYIVDPMLVYNWGPEARGTVWVSPQALSGPEQALVTALIKSVLGAPNNVDLFLDLLDTDAMLEQAGLPKGDGFGQAVPIERTPEEEEEMMQRASRRDVLRRVYRGVFAGDEGGNGDE